jgi:hypothetical protein
LANTITRLGEVSLGSRNRPDSECLAISGNAIPVRGSCLAVDQHLISAGAARTLTNNGPSRAVRRGDFRGYG